MPDDYKMGVTGGKASLGSPALGIIGTPAKPEFKKTETEDTANDDARKDKDNKDPS